MSIRRVVPDITCNRIHESRKFYTEFLGFDVAMDMDWVVTLASPSNPTAQITLVQEMGSTEPQANMTIEVDDIQAFRERMVSATPERARSAAMARLGRLHSDVLSSSRREDLVAVAKGCVRGGVPGLR